MSSPKAWIQGKLKEPCACASGRTYHKCCYRRECVYFVVGIFTALSLFGARMLPELLMALPFLLLAAFLAKLYYDRDRQRQKKNDNAS